MDQAAIETPVGIVEIGVEDSALVSLHFVDRSDAPPDEPSGIAARVRAYFNGDLDAIDDLPVRFERGTPFQRAVWDALRTIPPGETISYAELARRVGRPGAYRAVGAANGQNPVGVVVPCHRVIAADGTLGGYGGGLDRKRWLLAHEGAALVA
ncbi:MAG TPA: methylated-DNA--[protein]-cysteine S-methyltransferase [Acidimicrobiia bacterium]|jgi:methylated-DNA-[protein]-cysteine S-methyltransferase